jgi:exosome complex exonuclease RRP6
MAPKNPKNYRERFVPQLTEKLFAIEPLDSEYQGRNVYTKEIQYCLKSEIERIKQLIRCDSVKQFKSVEETELVYVKDESTLRKMIEDIEAAGDVAIDLEHNDFRSYRGVTCLIQLSTREKDYIVDPFPLWDHLNILNRITANPAIRKTFHAGDLDIQWLQRDFSVYVVNMFDTAQAAKLAEIEGGFGLGNLLTYFCGVKTDKKYQMSDWRLRPLSEGKLAYARMDTHFLLYIRDRLEEMILTKGSAPGIVTAWGKNMLKSIYEKSFGVSMTTYEDVPPDYESRTFRKFLSKFPGPKAGSIRENPQAEACLRAILKWRDEVARDLDESKHYVLSNALSVKLANAYPLTEKTILRLVGDPGRGSFAGMKIDASSAQKILAVIAQGQP